MPPTHFPITSFHSNPPSSPSRCHETLADREGGVVSTSEDGWKRRWLWDICFLLQFVGVYSTEPEVATISGLSSAPSSFAFLDSNPDALVNDL